MPRKKGQRGEAILKALAEMLESERGQRITTASLAAKIGVSEAALYRHYPSKAKIFEELIIFAEETLFSLAGQISRSEASCKEQVKHILTGILVFSERNPGISRLLSGEALSGEDKRLRLRVCQLFDRLETQLKQIIRKAEHEEHLRPTIPLVNCANLFMAVIEGKVAQYVRSDFGNLPTSGWDFQCAILIEHAFTEKSHEA